MLVLTLTLIQLTTVRSCGDTLIVQAPFKCPGHCALESQPQFPFRLFSATMELVSQYTEDAFAKEARLCQRPACGANIAMGDPCFYVATIEHGKPGRYVCGPCHERYQRKAATSVRPAGKNHYCITMSITNKDFQFALHLQIHVSFGSQ